MKYEQSYILAVETSSRVGSVAIGRGERLIASARFASMSRHGVELIPTVRRLFEDNGIVAGDVDVVCVSGGPGSFTGLRVGFAFARALAQVVGAKLVKVSSTDVIVENIKPILTKRADRCSVAVVIDAKRNQVFSAGFDWDVGSLRKTLDDCVLFPDDLIGRLSKPILVAGEGLMFHRENFDKEGIEMLDEAYWRGDAENVYKLGWGSVCREEFVDIDEFVPNYIRLPEAEERWLENNKK